MNTFTHIERNKQPRQIRSRVVNFVQENYTTEEILRRIPESVTDAFLGDYLAATDQQITRIHGKTDTVILQESLA